MYRADTGGAAERCCMRRKRKKNHSQLGEKATKHEDSRTTGQCFIKTYENLSVITADWKSEKHMI